MTRPYARYAEIYDRTGQNRFGAAMVGLTLKRLADEQEEVETALDLACGTGSAAIELCRRGMTVTGIELEPAMLGMARTNAARVGFDISWRLGDMRNFNTRNKVDLVTCFFDSVNYLPQDDDLAGCFLSVAAALRPGGWFAFDLNTIKRFAEDWNDSTFVAYDDGDLFCVVRSTYDADSQRSPLFLTTFQRDSISSNRWTRWDEEHIEYGYRLAQIGSLLKQAGFDVLECHSIDDMSMTIAGPGTEESGRVLYITKLTKAGGDA
jgi:SAM-dependent methyltransferase